MGLLLANMPPKGKGAALGPPRSCPPPLAKGGAAGRSSKNVLAVGAAASGAAGATAAAGAYTQLDEESEEEGEEEEESEEAQVCWGAVFSFLPIIIEIVMEFAGAAADAVRAQRLAFRCLI